MESNIFGLEAGFDIQVNQIHTLGAFVSYRNGEYDLNGKGKKFYSAVGSQIDINSYVGGLYYRYDYLNAWVFATIYGGIQKDDIETDDGMRSDLDGVQLGGSIDAGYAFNLTNTLMLRPGFGLSYTQVNLDDVKDSVGKMAKYDTISQTELEAAIQLEKYFVLRNGIIKTYVKPGLVQVITTGDNVSITGLGNKISTYNDGTLGRVEVGVKYDILNQLSAYGFGGYTFGSDYKATYFNIGLNFTW